MAVGDTSRGADNADASSDASEGGSDASRWSKRIGLKTVVIVQAPFPKGLPCGRADCGGAPTCSDTPTGGGYTCAFQKAGGKCNQSLTPWHVPLGQCCTTCFECSEACLAVNHEKLEPGGLSMVFRVNGVPVFIKGANWIATDQFEPRIPQRKGTHTHTHTYSESSESNELVSLLLSPESDR